MVFTVATGPVLLGFVFLFGFVCLILWMKSVLSGAVFDLIHTSVVSSHDRPKIGCVNVLCAENLCKPGGALTQKAHYSEHMLHPNSGRINERRICATCIWDI